MRKDLFVYGPETRRAREHFLAEQSGRCAICGTSERMLVADHEHSEMGLVRGLLCDLCNQGLGFLGDTLERLEIAVDYLREHTIRNEAYAATDAWKERCQPPPARLRQGARGSHIRMRDRQIAAAARAGECPEAIALRFDVSLSTVYRVVQEGRVSNFGGTGRPSHREIERQQAEFRRLVAAGVDIDEAAKQSRIKPERALAVLTPIVRSLLARAA